MLLILFFISLMLLLIVLILLFIGLMDVNIIGYLFYVYLCILLGIDIVLIARTLLFLLFWLSVDCLLDW